MFKNKNNKNNKNNKIHTFDMRVYDLQNAQKMVIMCNKLNYIYIIFKNKLK